MGIFEPKPFLEIKDEERRKFFEVNVLSGVRLSRAYLLKRFATVEEVAAMVAYICSERASATTGSALRVDGGVIRAIA